MLLGDLLTAVQLNLPIKVVVYNNSASICSGLILSGWGGEIIEVATTNLR